MLTIGGQRAAAPLMGSHFNLILILGLVRPGFMLPPCFAGLESLRLVKN